MKRREQKKKRERDLGITRWPISQRYNVRDAHPRRTARPIRAAVAGATPFNRDD